MLTPTPWKQDDGFIQDATRPTCATCQNLPDCIIFRFVRETQISNIQPGAFGCMWHEEADHDAE